MLYWHLNVLHDGAGTVVVNSKVAKSVYQKIVHKTTKHVQHSMQASMHADYLGGGFSIGISPKASQARSTLSASEDQRILAEHMTWNQTVSYTLVDGQTLAMITLMECDKINNSYGPLGSVDDGDEACFHTVRESPTVYLLTRGLVENLLTTFPGYAFDTSWAARLGTWGVKASVLSTSAIEDSTTLTIYSRPKLIEHSVGKVKGRYLDWVTVRPGMFISVRAGGFVDSISLGNTTWGGVGGFTRSLQPECDEVITTIGGRAGDVLDRVYFGVSPERGHDSEINRGIGGAGGKEFCWNPEKVGRIYRISAESGWCNGYNVISKLRILSTM
ncbi:unnamed protein product [Ectocarpus sp. CCAP 1310/34]|nr:unnamed protein product [Ectocarpus sp. CCAP 1310/34]